MPGRLWTLADSFRSVVVAQLAAAGRPAVAVSYVSVGGNVAYDCESVIVHVEDMRTGQPGAPAPGPVNKGTGWTVQLAAHVVRDCQPVGDGEVPPTEAERNAAALELLEDAAVFPAIVLAFAGSCNLVVVSGTFPGPLGDTAAAVLRVQVGL